MNNEFQREQALFDAALPLPPAERAGFLDQNCGDDHRFRHRVESLLRSHEQSTGVLDRQAVPPAKTCTGLFEQPGDRIGRYKLLEKIGEGGCGAVYMAEQESPVRRRVALKIIKLGMDTRQVMARFEAERQALAVMDHPNIARVFDAAATATGRPYFVMELVRGTKITDYCDQNKLPTHERLDLFLQTCRAIQHAHQKGIIHRDIKPSNILVTLHDGEPMVKVIDFGIAKATNGQRLTDQTLFTAFEQFVGTPAYMSPEQAQLTTQDIDTRTDIYSLGVLLYELLTGRTPFETRELLRAGLDAMLRTLRERDPARPSTCLSTLSGEELTRTARQRRTDAPKLVHLLDGDLDWIVMKCLEKNRSRRYETVNGLAMDVRRHLHGEPVFARPPSNLYRFKKFVRRHRLVVVAISGIIVALLGGLGFSLAMWSKERKAHRRATAAEEVARQARTKTETEAVKNRQVAAFLKDLLESAGASVAAGSETKTLREVVDRTAARVGRDLAGRPDVEAELRSILGSTYLKLRENDKAAVMAREALRLRRSVFGETNALVARSLTELARALVNLGQTNNFAEAEKLARQALSLWSNLPDHNEADEALSLYVLGSALQRQRRLAEAEPAHREALAVRRRVLKEHPEVASSLHNLAGLLRGLGRHNEAEPLLREALAMDRKLLGNEHPDVLTIANSLASLLTAKGNPAEAEPLAREALALRRKLYGAEHVTVAGALANLAHVLGMMGHATEAEPLFKEALAMRRRLLGDESHDVAWSLASLAGFLEDQQRWADAEAPQRELLALRRKLFGNENLQVANTLYDLARSLLQQGRTTEAETPARECLALREKLISDRPPTDAARVLLGRILLGQERYGEAEVLLLAASRRTERRGANDPADRPDRNQAASWLVRLYEATGQTNRAAEWKQKWLQTTNTAN